MAEGGRSPGAVARAEAPPQPTRQQRPSGRPTRRLETIVGEAYQVAHSFQWTGATVRSTDARKSGIFLLKPGEALGPALEPFFLQEPLTLELQTVAPVDLETKVAVTQNPRALLLNVGRQLQGKWFLRSSVFFPAP